MTSFAGLKQAANDAHAAVAAGRRTEAIGALSRLKDVLEARSRDGTANFDGIVTMQAIGWALDIEAPPLALDLTTQLLQNTVQELERLIATRKQQLIESKKAESLSTLCRAYACTVTFIPWAVAPWSMRMLLSFAKPDSDEAKAIASLLQSVRPRLDKADWFDWQCPHQVICDAKYVAAQVLIATASEMMQNPMSGDVVEQSFHAVINGLALLPTEGGGQVFADGQNALGQVFLALGISQYKHSLDCFLKCIEVEEKLENLKDAARDHMNAGVVAMMLMQFNASNNEREKEDGYRAQAQSHLVTARDMLRSQNDREGLADVLVNLGTFYAFLRDWKNAELALQEALQQVTDWWNQILDPRDDRVYSGVKLAGNLASLYCDMENYGHAFEYLRKANDFLSVLKNPETDALLQLYATAGRALYKTENFEKAYSALRVAVNTLEELRSSFSSELTNLQLLKVYHWVYDYLIACTVNLGIKDPSKYSEGFELAERVKWRMFTVLLRYVPLRMVATSEEPLVAEEEKLLSAEPALGDPIEAVVAPSGPRRRIEQIWDELEAKHPEYVAIRRQKTIGLAEAVRLLDHEVPVLVEYFLGEESGKSVAFVAKRGAADAVAVSLPATPSEITDLVRELRRQTDDKPVRDFNAASQNLRRILFEPIAQFCDAGSGICFVPYGELHNLPFGALFDGERYLIERNALVVAPGGSALRWWVKKDRRAAERCMLFTATSNVHADDEKLIDLHLFRSLAQNDIAPLFRESMLNPPDRQTKEYLLKSLAAEPAWDVVHLACHGITHEDGMNSFLALGGDAADPEKDLKAIEIMAAVRSAATLVTLSACHSAVAHNSTGDDVSGLAQGFLVAGASSVLASNTYVVQSAGVAITRGFYEAWLGKGSGKRETKIAALRASQLAAIGAKGWFGKRVWHPHQWGSFQLYGSWH